MLHPIFVLGTLLALAGLFMGWRGENNERAGGKALDRFSLEGPVWLILVAIGAGLVVVQWWRDGDSFTKADRAEVEEPETPSFTEALEIEGPFDFGDDPILDELWIECDSGDMELCDSLFIESPVGSEYEYFGVTCGWRIEPPDGEPCAP